MVILTRHEESIKARLCFAFQYTFTLIQQSFTFFWITLNIFFFFLCQKLSKVFWLSKPWKQNLCYSSFSFPSPFVKKNSPRTNRLNSFCVSLLPFPKEQRTNRLNSFVSPFSLVKGFKTTQSENSFDSSLSHIQKISKD